MNISFISTGTELLKGSAVNTNLRCFGSALAAEGITVIDNIVLIERGYDDIVGKLAAVGADIRKVSFPD